MKQNELNDTPSQKAIDAQTPQTGNNVNLTNDQQKRNDSDGNSNVGASNEFNTAASRRDARDKELDGSKDLRSDLENSF